jgi:hypothetical protein
LIKYIIKSKVGPVARHDHVIRALVGRRDAYGVTGSTQNLVFTRRWGSNNATLKPMKKSLLDYFKNDHWLVRLVVLIIILLTGPAWLPLYWKLLT